MMVTIEKENCNLRQVNSVQSLYRRFLYELLSCPCLGLGEFATLKTPTQSSSFRENTKY